MHRNVYRLVLALFLYLTTTPVLAVEVGVDYHSFTPNFSQDSVLARYHQEIPATITAPAQKVRTLVKEQLQDMKTMGVDFVSTRIYIGAPANTPVENRPNPYLLSFPPTEQDLQNLADYVDDVQDAGLTLDLGFLWLGQADFTQGCVDPDDDGDEGCLDQGLGFGNQPLNTFRTNLRANTIARVLQRIQAGEVRNFYFDGEVLYHPNPNNLPIGDLRRKRRNENWFFENGYGYFAHILTRDGKGQPMVYFLPTSPSNLSTYPGGILNNSWHNLPDPEYPATQGHRTMYWPYRSLLFIEQTFAAKGWPSQWMFDRFDFSFYADTPTTGEYDDWIDRSLDDSYAVIVNRFGLQSTGFAELSHFGNQFKRRALCRALRAESSRLDFFSFWTTVFSEERQSYGNVEVAFPPDIGGC